MFRSSISHFFSPRLAGLGLLSVLAGCGAPTSPETKSSPEAPSAKIRVTQVETREFAEEIEALGTVRAMEGIEISASVTDRVVEVTFEDGDTVKKGDLLIRLEDAEEVAVREAASALLAEQTREIARLEDLVKSGAVPQVTIQEYQTQREIAQQRVAEAEAQIADRHIVAPFDGVLGFRQVSVGALVSPGDTIATLDILDPVKLDFSVPETFLEDLEPGHKIVAATEAFPDEPFAGTVTQTDTRVNPVTRSATVRAEVPNPDKRLRPGMLMTTTLRKNPRQSLSVPERAILSVQSRRYVFVVDADGKTVRRTPVTPGIRVPGFVEITEGLEKGQTIVTDGLVGLTDGASVTVTGTFSGPAPPYRPEPVSP